ncbi:hypothetical protein R5R35_001926 [Gryllus longicercus]|uniref:Uncharacterized protein n=1 Tax=Gryllus longicercus TaxID=2509291 RepID=A0AAN9V748_9ORTH
MSRAAVVRGVRLSTSPRASHGSACCASIDRVDCEGVTRPSGNRGAGSARWNASARTSLDSRSTCRDDEREREREGAGDLIFRGRERDRDRTMSRDIVGCGG